MGNVQSDKKSKDLTQIIDYIATNFILTNNFKDFKNLTDQEYCNNLVILTSKIINNNLNYKQVEYLSQRIKKGEEVNEMTKDNVIFFEKDKLDKIDIDSNIRKKRLCLGIAKFYIKIAHIYAAIVTTVNPTYKYKNENGEIQEVNLENKIYIPKYSNITINRNNLCSVRINSLLNNSNFDVSKDEKIKINPKFCDKNLNKETGKTKMLINEPGIPELSKLYYDKYDYNTGSFIGMTEKTKKIYENDVKLFYKTFTGKQNIPNNIKTFSDIRLKEFHNMNKCKNNGAYTKVYEGTKKQKYFKKYAEHIENMMRTTNENQNKLIKIIDKIFVLIHNKNTKKREIIINPKLTYKNLNLIIKETKTPIINLYLKCEKDYLEGLRIFEVIVNMLYKETSENQLVNLEDNIEKIKLEEQIKLDERINERINNINNEIKPEEQNNINNEIKPEERKKYDQIIDAKIKKLDERINERINSINNEIKLEDNIEKIKLEERKKYDQIIDAKIKKLRPNLYEEKQKYEQIINDNLVKNNDSESLITLDLEDVNKEGNLLNSSNINEETKEDTLKKQPTPSESIKDKSLKYSSFNPNLKIIRKLNKIITLPENQEPKAILIGGINYIN